MDVEIAIIVAVYALAGTLLASDGIRSRTVYLLCPHRRGGLGVRRDDVGKAMAVLPFRRGFNLIRHYRDPPSRHFFAPAHGLGALPGIPMLQKNYNMAQQKNSKRQMF